METPMVPAPPPPPPPATMMVESEKQRPRPPRRSEKVVAFEDASATGSSVVTSTALTAGLAALRPPSAGNSFARADSPQMGDFPSFGGPDPGKVVPQLQLVPEVKSAAAVGGARPKMTALQPLVLVTADGSEVEVPEDDGSESEEMDGSPGRVGGIVDVWATPPKAVSSAPSRFQRELLVSCMIFCFLRQLLILTLFFVFLGQD